MSELASTLAQRGTTYGDFRHNAIIADGLMKIMQGEMCPTNWQELDSVKRQALSVIAQKISRILSPTGNPDYKDNWHDIQGYAKLAEDRCTAPVHLPPHFPEA